jgi:bifunctional non-homologous end joining protein LigD
MPALDTYHAKRNFRLTSEPRGKIARGRPKALRFVIQRHDARRLHYDLRLELGGVYKSWAVTKVPSLDPAVKRLAVKVENHPLAYGTFEGIIPKGQYGGGTVQLWDRGRWRTQTDAAPQNDLAKGRLKFELFGKRMRGGWALIRMRGRNWLLIKEKDAAARPGRADLLLKAKTSVKSGRTLKQIAIGAKPKRK